MRVVIIDYGLQTSFNLPSSGLESLILAKDSCP